MRKIPCLTAIILFAAMLCSYLGNAQVVIETTCNTARLSFETSLNSETISISIFKDTLIFEENFENFLSDQVISGTTIGAAGYLVEIPHSLTQYPGCRAQNIKVNDTGWCYITGGKFSTPKIYAPVSSVVFLKVSSNKDNTLILNNETKNIAKGIKTESFTITTESDTILFSNNSGKNLLIDYIKIISPREYLLSDNWDIVEAYCWTS